MTVATREVQLTDMLEALTDPVRVQLLRVLREGHEHCKDLPDYLGIHVSDLTKQMDLPQPTVSRHLARLRQVGLVRVERRAQWMYYTATRP
ncbi:helix-turn-helix transcriptional regulator [Deinococcus sp. QL22]|uniref:ArsR/SmtB family transcription factor n=1 Tax=Deinococcus sp. QL22 TaxID=2939437 RepID=UPI002017597D|nr:metalloregulator ArsR/SmtB family transcription factor [Deinococcus sp. QL22]UQN08088.1 metalloregulator ArsR/SmtB family transcription factor [Deinococcus sp. QL22]